FEDSGAIHALVLELVEGETLADRSARGPIPIDEALPIARQICEALDAAHERGIIHRDLKPANIKITPDGVVKVLDFGLAKIVESVAAGDVSKSPTVGGQATRHGTITGTVAYMSPEQARGQVVDKRTDVWAFGCVLYEMVTGRAPFVRATMSDTIVAILEHQPDWTQLPKTAPAAMTRLLERCLAKNPRQRLRDLGDARLEIADILAAPAGSTRAATDAAPVGRSLLWAAVLVGIAIVGGAALWRLPQRAPGPAAGLASRLVIQPPAGEGIAVDGGALALSPDGRRVAYVAGRSNR